MDNSSILTQSYRTVKNAVSSSDSDSSDSDSDADVWKRRSSRKRTVHNSPVKPMETAASESIDAIPPTTENGVPSVKRRKINTIWCNVLQEQTVSDDLLQCGLKRKPISYQDRSCESYDFRLSATDPRRNANPSTMETDLTGSEDACDEVKFEECDENSDNPVKNSSTPAFWPKIQHESRDVISSVSKKVIKVLGEPKHYLIYRAVQVLGSKKALEFLGETEKIEEDGGMFVVDNSRRRTPGGIFLQLIKQDTSISKKKKAAIFAEERRMAEKAAFRRSKGGKQSRRKKKNGKKSGEFMELCSGEKQDDSSFGSNESVQNVENTAHEEEKGSDDNVEKDSTNTCEKGGSGTLEDNCTSTRDKDSELEEGEITD